MCIENLFFYRIQCTIDSTVLTSMCSKTIVQAVRYSLYLTVCTIYHIDQERIHKKAIVLGINQINQIKMLIPNNFITVLTQLKPGIKESLIGLK